MSVGTYPYDIATLREGMSVLIGKVNNSHVILNQIENIPRSGTSYSVRRPIVIPPPPVETGQLLILNFEGVDGATTWAEEAQGLEFDNHDYWGSVPMVGCEIDTAQYYSGSSSLSLWKSWWFDYVAYLEIPGITNSFTFIYHFKPQSIFDGYFHVTLGCFGYNEATLSWIDMEFDGWEGGGSWEFNVDGWNDGNPSSWGYKTVAPDVWHEGKLVVQNRSFVWTLDDEVISSWEASVDNPVEGLTGLSFFWNGTNPIWVDEVSIANL